MSDNVRFKSYPCAKLAFNFFIKGRSIMFMFAILMACKVGFIVKLTFAMLTFVFYFIVYFIKSIITLG
jgi:hypothetical protein